MLKMTLGAAALVLATAAPAGAVTFVAIPGSAASFAAPAGGTTVTFDGALPASITRTGGSIVTGSSGNLYAQPAFSDGSAYLTVGAGGVATLTSTIGYRVVSLYLGSVDTFNTIDILSTAGTVIQTFTGSTLLPGANGSTSARFTFTAAAGDPAIGGLRFSSSQNALETDNIAFLQAVPEPATWVMMLLGFGAVGYSMRRRRAKTQLAYAV